MSKVDTSNVDSLFGSIGSGAAGPPLTREGEPGLKETPLTPEEVKAREGNVDPSKQLVAASEDAKDADAEGVEKAKNLPITGGQRAMANANLTAAGTAVSPGDTIRGNSPHSVTEESVEDALARSSSAADDEAFGFTPLDDHPPLKPGDKIQGPKDRANRDPTPAELEYGQRVRNEGNLTDEEKKQLENFKPPVIDPPIDKNAPKDVPADPRKVAESRGMVFKDKEVAKV